MADILLDIDALRVTFDTGSGPIAAVRSASLTIHRGEIVAIVGESGSGKSTLAKALGAVHPPSNGSRCSVRLSAN